jgi:hypothetical protein
MSGKRLALYLGGAVVVYLLVIFVVKPLLPPSPEAIHMKQVREHIVKITPAWNSFRSTNEGFDLVRFSVYTGGDGLFGIGGYLTSEVQRATLLRFIAETSPPRDLFTNGLKIVSPDFFQIALEDEPGHAANQQAPSGTNRTPAAAGPGR